MCTHIEVRGQLACLSHIHLLTDEVDAWAVWASDASAQDSDSTCSVAAEVQAVLMKILRKLLISLCVNKSDSFISSEALDSGEQFLFKSEFTSIYFMLTYLYNYLYNMF